jgi:hypothetical protein
VGTRVGTAGVACSASEDAAGAAAVDDGGATGAGSRVDRIGDVVVAVPVRAMTATAMAAAPTSKQITNTTPFVRERRRKGVGAAAGVQAGIAPGANWCGARTVTMGGARIVVG